MSQWSVSLGKNAVPQVKTAVAHAQAHRDHDPRVEFFVTADGIQKAAVVCPECEEMTTDE